MFTNNHNGHRGFGNVRQPRPGRPALRFAGNPHRAKGPTAAGTNLSANNTLLPHTASPPSQRFDTQQNPKHLEDHMTGSLHMGMIGGGVNLHGYPENAETTNLLQNHMDGDDDLLKEHRALLSGVEGIRGFVEQLFHAMEELVKEQKITNEHLRGGHDKLTQIKENLEEWTATMQQAMIPGDQEFAAPDYFNAQ